MHITMTFIFIMNKPLRLVVVTDTRAIPQMLRNDMFSMFFVQK